MTDTERRHKLKVLDLFSGIGGFSLGLERTGGFETIAFCEIDNYCQRVLRKHWPHVFIHSDIRKLGRANFEGWQFPDVITGGFPCQDISHAGLGAGLSGERSGLWVEMHRLIYELRPRFVIVENVAALLDRGMGRVLGDLAEAGFDAEWALLRAEDFGAPHERERLFAVAYPNRSDGEAWMGSELDGARQIFAADHRRRLPIWLQTPRAAAGMANGVSRRLDYGERVTAIGNAIVPQIAEWLGERILQAEQAESEVK